MEWDVIDSASQAVRRIEIWAIGSGVRVGFDSGRTSRFGRNGVSSSTSRLSSNLVGDIDNDVFLSSNERTIAAGTTFRCLWCSALGSGSPYAMIPRKDCFRCSWETRFSEKIRRTSSCFDVIDRRIGQPLGGIQLES